MKTHLRIILSLLVTIALAITVALLYRLLFDYYPAASVVTGGAALFALLVIEYRHCLIDAKKQHHYMAIYTYKKDTTVRPDRITFSAPHTGDFSDDMMLKIANKHQVPIEHIHVKSVCYVGFY